MVTLSKVLEPKLTLWYAGIVVGFEYETKSFDEGAVGDATVLVFGEALQGFSVVYVQGKIFNIIFV